MDVLAESGEYVEPGASVAVVTLSSGELDDAEMKKAQHLPVVCCR